MSTFAIEKFLADRRDGHPHSEDEFNQFCQLSADGTIPDYQISAWLMAAFLRPLDLDQTVLLTQAMAASGSTLDLSSLPKPWVDKHSTGGVGDKTSLVILPLLASLGITMVKMSGRGLGITGGTVDKLLSIPGFRMDLEPNEMLAQAQKIGIAVTGQSHDLAPADKVFYAIRDTTATVSSIPLIVSSILSKKLAGGADTIVIDVKVGSGAFMPTLAEGQKLGSWLTEVGTKCGKTMLVHLSDMDQPLGETAGNAIEVNEAIKVLTNQPLSKPSQRFRKLVIQLAASTIAEVQDVSIEQALPLVTNALTSGKAAAKAEQWFKAQGASGLAVPVEDLPTNSIGASKNGWISHIDAGKVGEAVVMLGGGRRVKTDTIDPQVGIITHCLVGDQVTTGQAVLDVRCRDASQFKNVEELLNSAIQISDSPVPEKPLFLPKN